MIPNYILKMINKIEEKEVDEVKCFRVIHFILSILMLVTFTLLIFL